MAQQRRATKAELVKILTDKVNQWISNGDSPETAVGKLTERQYDFLIDQGVDFDSLLLTPEQRKNAQTIKRAGRSKSPNGYNKKYPKSKQELYNGIVEYIRTKADTVTLPQKANYRDLDFTIDGTKYKIVLSNPRT